MVKNIFFFLFEEIDKIIKNYIEHYTLYNNLMTKTPYNSRKGKSIWI